LTVPVPSPVTTDASVSGSISNLVNGSTGNNTGASCQFTSAQSNKNITFDFGSGVRKLITAAYWYQNGSSSHGSWKWQGSNDNSSWTDLSSAFTLDGSSSGTKMDASSGTLLANNTSFYRYYRILQTSGSTSTIPWLWEICFKIVDFSVTHSVPDYGNDGGQGDRTASITVTTDATLAAGTPAKLVNNNWGANSSNATAFNSGQSNKNLTFDFGSGNAKRITEARVFFNSSGSQGTWKWQGSNDNSSWTDLTDGFTLNDTTAPLNGGLSMNGALGASVGVGTVLEGSSALLANNTNTYRYYRMLQTSGSTSSTPWIIEFVFKIAG
jgi:hypothetical protein